MKLYIIVAFHEGIAHTLQLGGKIAWNFSRPMKLYKSLDRAKKMAHKVNTEWRCDKVRVYEIEEGECVSSSKYREWDDRIRYEINNKS